jgi:hypothetical protein
MMAVLVAAQHTTQLVGTPTFSGVHHRVIAPSDTDPTIGQCAISPVFGDECPDRGHDVYTFSGFIQVHWFVPPKLLVIIPAHCSEAGTNCGAVFDVDYAALVQKAINLSYTRVIVLDYPNENPELKACKPPQGQQPDPTCTGKMRDEISFGNATSTHSGISTHPQDAIVPRLRALLTYLKTTYPSEGWETWMSGTAINWADVTLAGHSGYAPFIATRKLVSRVAMFSEPSDSDATWIDDFSSNTATPVDRYWGLINTHDQVTNGHYERVVANWAAMGILGGQGIQRGVACTGSVTKSCHLDIVEDEAVYGDNWASMLGWGD